MIVFATANELLENLNSSVYSFNIERTDRGVNARYEMRGPTASGNTDRT